jgi:hypothetical protein
LRSTGSRSTWPRSRASLRIVGDPLVPDELSAGLQVSLLEWGRGGFKVAGLIANIANRLLALPRPGEFLEE